MEKFLLSLDQYPLAALWRLVLGSMMPIVAAELNLPFLLFFIVVLVALRIGPALLRRLLPVSMAVKEEWARRRQLAKVYDSYQWQKLFWIGIGLLLNLLLTGPQSLIACVVAGVCVVGGALGLVFWFRRAAATGPQVTAI